MCFCEELASINRTHITRLKWNTAFNVVLFLDSSKKRIEAAYNKQMEIHTEALERNPTEHNKCVSYLIISSDVRGQISWNQKCF